MSCEHAKTVPWADCHSCEECGEDGICDSCLFGFDRVVEDGSDDWVPPLHRCPETIKVCSRCLDEQEVPLIWTFAFNGAEYWCPKCGDSTGMLGGGEKVPWSKKLHQRLKNYQDYTRPYLRAHGALVCSELYWNGEYVRPRDLPKEELDRLMDVCTNGWKPGLTIL